MLQKIKEYSIYLFLLFFFIIWYGVFHHWFDVLDQQIYSFTQLFFSDFMTLLMKFLSFLGSSYWLFFATLILFWLLKKNVDRVYFLLVSLFSETTNLILKNWIQRPRPSFPHFVVENSFSFPSGHAMGAMTFYGAMIYFIWKSSFPIKIKVFFSILLAIMIEGICFSRLYLGVHYFSDVLAGVCLSIFLLGFISLEMKKKIG